MPARSSAIPLLPSTMPLWPSRDQIVRTFVLSLLALNVFDAVCTVFWVRLGIAEEANPLLRPLLEHSTMAFFVVKMSMVCAGLGFLWYHREVPLVKVGLAFATAVYGSLAVYHMDIAVQSLDLFSLGTP